MYNLYTIRPSHEYHMAEPGKKIQIAIWWVLVKSWPHTKRNNNKSQLNSISVGELSDLCLAVALSRCPHIEVDMYEATGQFKEIGAGVMIRPGHGESWSLWVWRKISQR